MSALTPLYLAGMRGLQTNKKPMFIADQAWQTLENAYAWRDRVIKREGLRFIGRLQREFTNIDYFLSGTSPWTFNLLVVTGFVEAVTKDTNGVVTTTYPHGLTTGDKVVFSNVGGMTQLNGNTYTITVVDAYDFELNVDTSSFTTYTNGGSWISNRSILATEGFAELNPGSVVVKINTMTPIVFTDQGNGSLTSPTMGNSGKINYLTGSVTLTTTAPANTATNITFGYFPTLPGMGIWTQDVSAINNEQTIWWDEKYAYVDLGSFFQEFIPGTQWNSGDSDFFWAYNYRGNTAANRLLFVTNFKNDLQDPMYYTNGTTWTPFAPFIVSNTQTLFTAKILIAYYGRLLALNTWEGDTNNQAGAVNYFNRCRGCQLGDPTDQTNGWRTDLFGRGFFLDAPTNEAIISATFIKNTLIVKFERTTWQLRYVGEYGLPFIWERTSADYGSDSTFANVLVENEMYNVGDKAITTSNAIGVDRLDPEIPNQVFDIQNTNDGPERVWGIRDYYRELIFWNYPDGQTQSVPGVDLTFPNKVLVYNYRNKTYAIFRDSVTAFGVFQIPGTINWNSTTVSWDDFDVTWDGDDELNGFPSIAGLNQQGFAFAYGYTYPDEQSLSVQGINLSGSPIQLTVPNHNLLTEEIIFLDNMLFVDSSTNVPIETSLNGVIYQVSLVVDVNTIQISQYNFTDNVYETNFPYTFTPSNLTPIYIGGGTLALFPKLNLQSKDFSPYQQRGLKTKLSRIDFLMETTSSAAMTVEIFINSSPAVQGNMTVGQVELSTWNSNSSMYPPGSDYAWYRFFATCQGQFFNINLTYDDVLMNTLTTHEQGWTLYAINAFVKEGGKMV